MCVHVYVCFRIASLTSETEQKHSLKAAGSLNLVIPEWGMIELEEKKEVNS